MSSVSKVSLDKQCLNFFLYGLEGSAGASGPEGVSAYGGGRNGLDGGPGKPGKNGGNGHSVKIRLESSSKANQVKVHALGKTHLLKLGDARAQIRIDTHGGKGGKGGSGGPGGNGADGCDGRDASYYSSAEDGEDGGHGGCGGKGGNGGKGGIAGNLRITLAEEDTDLLLLFSQLRMKGGKGGPPGSGGRGGFGGRGGRGGDSFSWSTGVPPHMMYHYESEGRDGSSGCAGSDGRPGRQGCKGKDGHLEVVVHGQQGTKKYDGFYDLGIASAQARDSLGQGVYEPGENFEAQLEIVNRGPMPSPKDREVVFQVCESSALAPVDSIQLCDSLAPGQSKVLNDQVKGRVKELSRVPRGPAYDRQEKLNFSAVMSGVNKAPPSVAKFSVPIRVRYPVKMDAMWTEACITEEDQLPLLLRIHNVSSKAFGDLSGGRSLELHLQSSHGLQFKDLEGRTVDLLAGHTFSISNLDSNESQLCMGSLSFPKRSLEPFERIHLEATLILGGQKVQVREEELQVAEPYKESSTSDLLLVVNETTSKEEVVYWRGLAQELGFSGVSVWNQSLHQGFNLKQKKADGTSLAEDFRDQVVVFLNNEINGSDSLAQADVSEMVEQGRKLGLRFLFAGGTNTQLSCLGLSKDRLRWISGEGDEWLYGVDPSVVWSKEKQARYWFGHRAQEKHLRKKAEKLRQTLNKQVPERSFRVVYRYAPQIEARCLGEIAQLGELGVLDLSSRVESIWAASRTSNKKSHQLHLLQLLPFEEKLQRLLSLGEGVRPLLIDAILRDLFREQIVTREKRDLNKTRARNALSGLAQWRAFVEAHHGDLDSGELLLIHYAVKGLVQKQAKLFSALPFRDPQSKVSLGLLKKAKSAIQFDEAFASEVKQRGRERRKNLTKLDGESNLEMGSEVLSWEDYRSRFHQAAPGPFVEGQYVFSTEKSRVEGVEAFARAVV